MALIDGSGLLAGGLDSVAGTRRFWIGVASRDHVNVGIRGAFIQLNHGKQAPLRRLKAGDDVIMYSPRTAYPDGEPLQAFTAIGTVVTGDVYQVQVTPDFQLHRVDVQFVPARETHIKPPVEHLSFIIIKSRWGAVFRFGLVQVPARDFVLIAERMGAVSPCGRRADLLRVVSGSDRADRAMINSRSTSNAPASRTTSKLLKASFFWRVRSAAHALWLRRGNEPHGRSSSGVDQSA